ncbi:DUF1345 domain-containing protein [Paracoccus pacificus]|uniref:DUF1345 domain-containing protein n=1 Tax=Paracoccus pacificus TaxID=1463598 RepID=A0ABW4R8J9_9RHOB
MIAAVLLGLAVGVLATPLAWSDRLLLAANTFFLTYVVSTIIFIWHFPNTHWRRHFEDSDEGMLIVIPISVAVVIGSLAAILATLSEGISGGWLRPALVLISVPLGWVTLHMLAAFHYASLWYRKNGVDDLKGLAFPATDDPGVWEFLYHAFVIGMCAQVSDVTVQSRKMRATVLVHSVLSFFYNTVILALAVNVGVALGGSS